MGAALVAYIDRANNAIELNPGVRPGAALTGTREAILLHISELGHCREVAAVFASALRSSGWKVTIGRVDELAPLRAVNYDQMLCNLAEAGAAQIGPAEATPPSRKQRASQQSPPSHDGLIKRYRELWLCFTCCHVTTAAKHVESHKINLKHTDVRRVPSTEVRALQAQIRHAQAQASALEDQEALQEPSGQQVHGYTHPTDPAAVQALPDQGQP